MVSINNLQDSTKDLPFMSSKSWKERRKRVGLKSYLKKLWLKTLQIWQKIQIYIFKKLSEPQDTSKEIHDKIHHNQTLKTKDKEKDFESCEREHLTQKGETLGMTAGFSSETTEAEGSSTIFSKWWKQRTVSPEFYIQRKYPSGKKGKSRHSQMKEN